MTEIKAPLKIQMPSQGWKQFLTARKEMLDAYDRAKTLSEKNKVETHHGRVAEAEFRKWLINFLPKKYGVTSGYIISQGVSNFTKAPHFDVIIYEHLESPTLWIEENPDASKQGKSLAIPAEYVKCVIEVKSAFKNSNVKNAIKHLDELSPLLSNIDAPGERYKMYLPKDFFCSLVFFELRSEDAANKKALNSMIEGIKLRGFFGGLILRGEGITTEACGELRILRSDTEMKSFGISKRILPSGWVNTDSYKHIDNQHYSAMLMFTEPSFSAFAFDIIALLNGTFEVGRLSSFHVHGTSEWEEANRKETKK